MGMDTIEIIGINNFLGMFEVDENKRHPYLPMFLHLSLN